MGSNSLSRVALLFDEFFDLKNFLGLAMASEPEKQMKNDKNDKIIDNFNKKVPGFFIAEAFLIEVKEAKPHFPTIPADLDAETPEK